MVDLLLYNARNIGHAGALPRQVVGRDTGLNPGLRQSCICPFNFHNLSPCGPRPFASKISGTPALSSSARNADSTRVVFVPMIDGILLLLDRRTEYFLGQCLYAGEWIVWWQFIRRSLCVKVFDVGMVGSRTVRGGRQWIEVFEVWMVFGAVRGGKHGLWVKALEIWMVGFEVI